MRMDLKKYFSSYSPKMMISPYYFGSPVLIDPVYMSQLRGVDTNVDLEISTTPARLSE
jgi:hypothetical protein